MTFLDTALALARGGQVALEANRQRINDLNVYPVPDGDTGSNLADTAANLSEGLSAPGLAAEDRPAVAAAATRAALMGARGNSGVILSQIVRGFAQSLGEEPGAIDSAAVARALRAASDAAYRAVRQPVEGTMLTAIRTMAESAEEAPAGVTVHELLDLVLQRGDRTVEETQGMLQVLRDAGVVDAGAAGLVEYARGAVAGLRGERAADLPSLVAADSPIPDAVHAGESRYRYCTTFVLEGDEVDTDVLERQLEPLGDSLLVVGDRPTFKVHVHTDDPGAALSLGVAMGTVDRVEIANMQVQAAERSLRLIARQQEPEAVTGLVAVVAGEGNEEAFRAAGAAALVGGGQSMNPSTQEIAAGIAAAPGEGVIVLPNNRNVILAAEHAAALASRPTRVVPTQSVTAGLHCAEMFDPGRSLDDNAVAMAAAVHDHSGGELTVAVRGATVDGIDVEEGWYLALLDGRVVAAGPAADDVAWELATRMAEPGRSLTLIRGDSDVFDVHLWVEKLQAAHPAVEVRVADGGQPLYPLLFSARPARAGGLRTAANTAIVLDSTADVPAPEERHRNWRMVPLTVSFGDESFRDHVEMGPDEFYRRLRAGGELPRTAAPSPGAWSEVLSGLGGYERIIVLPVSAGLSASAQSAELAAREADPGGTRITVLDTESVSVGTLLLAEGLQRLLVRGVPENELLMWFEDARERLRLIFSVDTLEYLQRGGRIGRAQALVGGMLGVRPILTLKDGEAHPVRRVRGARRARAEFERFLLENAPEGPFHVAIVHAEAAAAATDLRAMVERLRPGAIVDEVAALGPVVGTHAGPGTLGMAILPGE